MMSRSRLLRCISVVMSVLMLFAVVPLTVSAADAEYTEISGWGEDIMEGGNFKLTGDTIFYGEIEDETVIDLNGHTLFLGEENDWDVIGVNATLTFEGVGTVKTSGQDHVIGVSNIGTLNIASPGVKFEGGTNDIFLTPGGKINCSVKLENSYTVSFAGAAGEKVVECGDAETALANQSGFIVNGKELVANGTQLCTEGEGILVQYVSLVLDGTIGLKFYFHFPDDAKPTLLYYQVGDGEIGNLAVGDYEAFIIDIPADRMDDTVYVWFDATEKPATVNAEYSVKNYIEKIKSTKSTDGNMYKLADALGVYGDFAVKYKNNDDNDQHDPSTYTAINEIFCDISYNSEPYKPVMNSSWADDTIQFTGMSLVLGSKTVMRLYLDIWYNKLQEPNIYGFEVTKDHRIRVYSGMTDADGSIYEVFDEQTITNSGTETGFGYVGDLKVDVEIPASKLGDTWRIEVGYTDNNGKWQCDASISVSPMWYIGNCIDGPELSSNAPLHNMACALFAYYYYANQFFGN